MLAGQVAALRGWGQGTVRDHRLVRRAVEHGTQVVRHAAVDSHPRRDVALDGLHRVERHRPAGHQRATRLEQQPLVHTQRLVGGAHDRLDVLAYRWRVLRGGVGNPQPTAQVVHGELAQLGDRADRGAEWLELEQLRADVEMQPLEFQIGRRCKALDRLRRLLHREAELGVGLAGRDRLVRIAGDGGRDTDHDLLATAHLAGHALQTMQVIEGIQHHVPHPR